MRVVMFSTKPYDRRSFAERNGSFGHRLHYREPRLSEETATLAAGFPAVCLFVNDICDATMLEMLAAGGTRLIALRCAGFNNVDLQAAQALGLTVTRVPAYSPQAVAEFTIGLILAVNRHIPRAWNRVRENNFSLDGLIGKTLSGRTAGVIGGGRVGALVAQALRRGFGCEVLVADLSRDPALLEAGVRYASAQELIAESDIISLHCPLTPETRHIIDADAIARARPGVIIVNTSRGALIDTAALIEGLKSRKVGAVALDVYEQEADLFFEDLSNEIVTDDVFQRLLTFPNVVVTGHQAFFTIEALDAIAQVTLDSLKRFETGEPLTTRVDPTVVRAG